MTPYPYQGYVNNMLISRDVCSFHTFSVWILATEILLSTYLLCSLVHAKLVCFRFSPSDTSNFKFPYDNLWISFFVPCPQGHRKHGDAFGRIFFRNLVYHLGSRSPDFQNASGMFQTQMCDSQLPHLGLGTVHSKGEGFLGKGESKTLIFTDQVMFQHLYESHV